MGMQDSLSKFPCSEISFKTASEQGRFWIDKTRFIRILEGTGAYNRMWRPKGFGKTLLCDMLAEYYDAANCKEQVSFVSFVLFCDLLTDYMIFC